MTYVHLSSAQNFSVLLLCEKSTIISRRRQTPVTTGLHRQMILHVLVRLIQRFLSTLTPIGPIGFAGRLSLAFLVPLLESQAATDPALCSMTVEAALGFIKDCPIGSLHAEPPEYIDALERLLDSWLHQASQSNTIPAPADQIAAARVALACARGSWTSMAAAVSSLIKSPTITSLPIASVLAQLASEISKFPPVWIARSGRLESWTYDKDAVFPSDSTANTAPDTYMHPKHPHPMKLEHKSNGWNCDGCSFHFSLSFVSRF